MQPTFIALESLEIARPCRANWNAMSGDERARFCKSCEKNVYNLSAMTREEAMRLIHEKEGNLCVRLHRRSDGTVITSDCPVGQTQTKWAPVVRVLMAAFGMVAGLVGGSGAFAQSNDVTVTAGAPVAMDMGEPMPMPTKVPVRAQPKKHGNARTTRLKHGRAQKSGHQRHRR